MYSQLILSGTLRPELLFTKHITLVLYLGTCLGAQYKNQLVNRKVAQVDRTDDIEDTT